MKRRTSARRLAGAALPLTLAATLAATACGTTDPDDVRTVDVAAHKAVCAGPFFRFCLQIRDVGSDEWTFAYDTPIGFEFEWGVRQRIVIEEEPIENPPPDGSSIRRTLVRIQDRRSLAADSVFTLVVPGGATSESETGVHQFHFGSEAFACTGRADCDQLATALGGNDAVEVTLALAGSAEAPFRLVDWRACGRVWPDCSQ
jgi:hypothetical protein